MQSAEHLALAPNRRMIHVQTSTGPWTAMVRPSTSLRMRTNELAIRICWSCNPTHALHPERSRRTLDASAILQRPALTPWPALHRVRAMQETGAFDVVVIGGGH